MLPPGALFELKIHQNAYARRASLRTPIGSLQSSQTPLLVFRVFIVVSSLRMSGPTIPSSSMKAAVSLRNIIRNSARSLYRPMLTHAYTSDSEKPCSCTPDNPVTHRTYKMVSFRVYNSLCHKIRHWQLAAMTFICLASLTGFMCRATRLAGHV